MGNKMAAGTDDAWVPSVCLGCYNCCGIKIHRHEGKVVDVVGDPAAPNSKGHICAKGKARFLDLHNPKRVLKPLRRGNPEKGIGVDPQWREITWEEALTEIAGRLRKIREEDPRRLLIAHFDLPAYGISKAFGAAFGTPNLHWNRADYCGSAPHVANLLLNGSFNGEIDFERCNFMVLWGTQLGALAETIPLHSAEVMADARVRGARTVVIDPFCSNVAAKANQWIPLRPGSDGLLALSMLNVICNELGRYDEQFLKLHTNAPYLIRKDGHYLRDAATRKPMVWDAAAAAAKPFDAEVGDFAIDGEYVVNGETVRPSFVALKEHLRQYTPEMAERETTVPAATIRKLMHDFVEAAQIGSTITVDGVELPYRPAAIHFKRGSGAHKGGCHSSLAIHMINLMVGNLDVPGGQRGVNPVGPYWEPYADEDGMLVPAQYITKYFKPYPPRTPKVPDTLDLNELFPASLFTRGLFPWGIREPEKFGLNYTPAMLLHCRTNLMMNSHNAEAMGNVLKKIEFQVSFATLIDETTEFADIVLPDSHDYERWDLFPANDPYAFVTPGPGEWFWLMRQQAVKPPGEARPWTEVYLELAERIGILSDLYAAGNGMWNIAEKHRLDPSKKYSVKDIAERQAKTMLGDDFDINGLDSTACMITRKKTVREAYPRTFLGARVPVYLEHLIDTGAQVKAVTDSLGLQWDFRPYTPLLTYFPCHAHEHEIRDGFDLLIVNFKIPFITFSVTSENLWIDEISRGNPYTHAVMINRATAQKKGIRDGDRVLIESSVGKGEGVARVTELIHPDCLGIPSTLGHWARAYSISKYKGTGFNNFLPAPDVDYIDTLSGQIDSCMRVRITRLSPKKS
jgi:anaerobic selenocysteine-containing dehydrogenase